MRVPSRRPGLYSIKALAPLAFLFAALALCPLAAAQYPGGGGYPGSAGWQPLKPDGTVGSGTLGDPATFDQYDWTGLTWTQTSTLAGNTQTASGRYHVPNSSAGTFGKAGAGAADSASVIVGGTSTVKYQWVPPNSDLKDFPAPSLYALGEISASSAVSISQGVGVSANGGASNGWGWSPTFSVSASADSGVSGQAPGDPSDNPRRRVLAGSSDMVNSLPASVFTLSPGASAGASGGSGATATATGDVGISEALCPIVLSSPNPLTNPTFGDGTNQYVYSADVPNGQLAVVPTSINVLGANTADLNWMLLDPANPLAKVVVLPQIPGQLIPIYTTSGSQILVQTDTGADFPTNGMVFIGLPQYISGFGTHVAILVVYSNNYNVSQLAHCQIFFPAEANVSNWPGSNGLPNWFYYYNQIYHFDQFPYNNSNFTVDGGYDPTLSLGVWARTIVGDSMNSVGGMSTDPSNWSFAITLGPNAMAPLDFPVFQPATH